MVTKEYSKAYTEILEILKHIPNEDVQKTSKEKLNF